VRKERQRKNKGKTKESIEKKFEENDKEKEK
jgi:hypothetical protein